MSRPDRTCDGAAEDENTSYLIHEAVLPLGKQRLSGFRAAAPSCVLRHKIATRSLGLRSALGGVQRQMAFPTTRTGVFAPSLM